MQAKLYSQAAAKSNSVGAIFSTAILVSVADFIYKITSDRELNLDSEADWKIAPRRHWPSRI